MALAGPLDHAVAARARDGQRACGDRASIRDVGGITIIAVVDGLGHGPGAATAAEAAVAAVEAADDVAPDALVQRCHTALRQTRGAALSVASITPDGRLAWLGVGNVRGAVVQAAGGAVRHLPTRGGVVGLRLPGLRLTKGRMDRDDLLVLATDGVRDGAVRDVRRFAGAATVARELLARHAEPGDDALVAALRYTGVAR